MRSKEAMPHHGVNLHQRRAVHRNFVAELAGFLVADDQDGFVLAQLRFAEDEHD